MMLVGSSAVSVDWKYPDDSTACIGAKMDVSNVVITYENETAEVTFNNATTTGMCGTAPAQSSSTLMINLANGDRMDFTFSISGANTRMDILFTFDPSNYFQNAPTVYECGADDVSTQSSAATSPQAATSEAPSNGTTTEPPAPSNGTTTEPPAPTNTSTTEPPVPSNTSTTEPAPSNTSTTEPPQSTPVVTTLPPVTTPPPSKASTYTYKEGNKTCVQMTASLQVQVQYETKNNDTNNKCTRRKRCDNRRKMLDRKRHYLIHNYQLWCFRIQSLFDIQFKVEDGKDMLSSVAYIIDLDSDFPDAKEPMVNGTIEGGTWSTPSNRFFKCDAVQTLGGMPVTIITRELKEQTSGLTPDFSNSGYECLNDTGKPPEKAPTGQFQFKEKNQTCVVFKGGLTLSLPYTNTKNQNVTATVAVPGQDEVTISGSCGTNTSNSQDIELSFYDGWKLKLTFTSDATSSNLLQANAGNNYQLSKVDVTYVLNNNIFEDVANPGESRQLSGNVTADTFKASSTGSYTCSKDQTVNLGQFSMTTNDMQFQAFMTKSNFTGFGDASECAKDDETNSIVPIAVGAALAGLVIIVLIAYLIGRRRSRSGYEQV
ncbi:hypothetical protein FSP39_018121 [Pinctada imbricata]|uniref:Lysosome-associated membrane glycoprotein 5 n=1 Tax=Pinctada imbricata TaxID=66713 RepID=A0AA88Y0R1_PINIB|nr:hypothetical protein FSP39_018121 [Pinctada imbricata]